jgi:hypothetical protein
MITASSPLEMPAWTIAAAALRTSTRFFGLAAERATPSPAARRASK